MDSFLRSDRMGRWAAIVLAIIGFSYFVFVPFIATNFFQRETKIIGPLSWAEANYGSTVIGLDSQQTPVVVFRAKGNIDNYPIAIDHRGRIFIGNAIPWDTRDPNEKQLLRIRQLSISEDGKTIVPLYVKDIPFDLPAPRGILATIEDGFIYIGHDVEGDDGKYHDTITKLAIDYEQSILKKVWSTRDTQGELPECSSYFKTGYKHRDNIWAYSPELNLFFFHSLEGQIAYFKDLSNGAIGCTGIDGFGVRRVFGPSPYCSKIGVLTTEGRFPGEVRDKHNWVLKVRDSDFSTPSEVIESKWPVRIEIDRDSWDLGNGIMLSDISCITYHHRAITLWYGNRFQIKRTIQLPKFRDTLEIIKVLALSPTEIRVVIAYFEDGQVKWCQLEVRPDKDVVQTSWKSIPLVQISDQQIIDNSKPILVRPN